LDVALMSFKPFQIRYLGYWLLAAMLLAAGKLDLATPLLTVLFSIFLLRKLRIGGSKLLPITFFLIIVLGILYTSGYFLKQAVDALPKIAEEAFPRFVDFAKEHKWELPVAEFDELKTATIHYMRTQLGYLGNFAKIATKEFAFLLIGLVVGISLFVNPQMDLEKGRYRLQDNLYSFACEEIVARFRSFYHSFEQVMGAQIIISTLNTGFTAIYLLAIDLPYAALVICITFLCGLLPIIGNLISNTIIVALSFRVSPQLAIASLIFLVVLHKLEYFLNSKIIGDRIKNPVWLTLLGLILGERLMGIPGMILAPVLLNFIKLEASTIPVPTKAQRERDDEEMELV
jgi:predicted PurR-regulated permease PerM